MQHRPLGGFAASDSLLGFASSRLMFAVRRYVAVRWSCAAPSPRRLRRLGFTPRLRLVEAYVRCEPICCCSVVELCCYPSAASPPRILLGFASRGRRRSRRYARRSLTHSSFTSFTHRSFVRSSRRSLTPRVFTSFTLSSFALYSPVHVHCTAPPTWCLLCSSYPSARLRLASVILLGASPLVEATAEPSLCSSVVHFVHSLVERSLLTHFVRSSFTILRSLSFTPFIRVHSEGVRSSFTHSVHYVHSVRSLVAHYVGGE